MKFKPEEVNFHREEYQTYLGGLRPKDYPLMLKKEVQGRANLRHRLPNPYLRDGKALVSFVLAGKEVKADILRAVDLLGGFCQIPEAAGPDPVETQFQQRRSASRLNSPRFPDCGHRSSPGPWLHPNYGGGKFRPGLGSDGESL